MNVVFVKHGCSKEYCFEVPDRLVPYIQKGTTVLVETMRGLDTGTTTTGVITGDGARDIAENNGAYFPLKPVISFLDDRFRAIVKNEIIGTLNGTYCKPYPVSTDLPF